MIELDYVGFLVCGSRTIGDYDSEVEDLIFSNPYQHYRNKEHVEVFDYWMTRLVDQIVEREQTKNKNFDKENILIVSGAANGPDDMASIWARLNYMNYLELPAQWKKYGKAAGYRRNTKMVRIVKYVFAAYDGTSRGTLHTIKESKKKGHKVKTVLFETEC